MQVAYALPVLMYLALFVHGDGVVSTVGRCTAAAFAWGDASSCRLFAVDPESWAGDGICQGAGSLPLSTVHPRGDAPPPSAARAAAPLFGDLYLSCLHLEVTAQPQAVPPGETVTLRWRLEH
ncbi:MAG: hypothetical protein RML36_11790 [Anaerolineae bacterium]|nr:hypothetical protein [Anaerolineae bacterium]MDW8100150.1 hypothetical protein [Anaerolineae bacterium]